MHHRSEMEDHFVKGSMEDHGFEDATDGSRRSLFRRGRRSNEGGTEQASSATRSAVATVDDLARRMDELATSVADDPVRAEFDLQRAVIARANDLAAANGAPQVNATQAFPPSSATRPTPVPVPVPTAATTPDAPEAPVQQTEDQTFGTTDIEDRMDAVLSPVAPPPASAPRAAEPAPAPVATVSNLTEGRTDAVALLGIDISRVVSTIQDEAAAVQQRIELEVRDAHVQATDIIDRAEAEADRIREHGQAQARVLLGEVEEIISEAQSTGEQILHRANDEASGLRKDATAVLQQAQTEARAIVETARREGEQVLAEQRRLATVRAQEAMREQDRLKDQIRRLEERRRQVLESLEPLISQLTQMMPAGVTDQNVVQLERQRALTNQG
ncbi:MAG: hypothetical protein JWM98_96 [Thermoleophilia bacterium]|nr:hypothetical protein [Thermoleophilia bacterium]